MYLVEMYQQIKQTMSSNNTNWIEIKYFTRQCLNSICIMVVAVFSMVLFVLHCVVHVWSKMMPFVGHTIQTRTGYGTCTRHTSMFTIYFIKCASVVTIVYTSIVQVFAYWNSTYTLFKSIETQSNTMNSS